MAALFRKLSRRVGANAQHAVDLYLAELPDFSRVTTDARGRAQMLEFAVLLRQRTADLADAGQPFGPADLAHMASVGRDRGERGVPLSSQRRVLGLHATLTLREAYEAAGPQDLDDVMRLLGWLPPNGTAAQNAYTGGFLDGQRSVLPETSRVEQLAQLLLADDPAAGQLARSLGMPAPDRYLVTVVQIRTDRPNPPLPAPHRVVETLLERGRIPISCLADHEVVGLVPDLSSDEPGRASDRALALAGDCAEVLGLPCSVGTATGRAGALAEAVTLARRVCRSAPPQATVRHLHSVTDLFAELGAEQIPQVDQWLGELVRRLRTGPDLLATLDAYYLSNMSRPRAAAALRVHPRTLDYRLRRAHELTGIDPHSVHGIRVLSTAAARSRDGTAPLGHPR
ncbi:MAG TPA: helix-turn-helix domain-containing protein [Mycobacteriales bacterium]|nr:helix-turn-helix domain-containing protein [Mycobacteriales bacterium]